MSARTERRRHGLVIVFTGDGKGKTTAAIGLALRASGNKMRVRIIQFIKGAWKTGEVEALKEFAPSIEITRAGRGFTIDGLRDERIPMTDHTDAARRGITEALEAIESPGLDVLVLDEILGTLNAGFVTVDELLDLLARRPPALHVVLTGRNAPAALVEVADLVTEMRLVKHPYERGIPAQRGVEF